MSKGHSGIGRYLGFQSSQADGGVLEISRMTNWSIPTNGLITHLDAGSYKSYPGTGTVWYDLSPNGYHYNIVAAAYRNTGPKYMDFTGNTGIAKSQNTSTVDAPAAYTMLLWTRIKNSTSDWRTMYRPYANDHTVIVESGSWRFGLYDNDALGYVDSGFLQTSFPNHGTTGWMLLHIRIDSASTTQWRMSYNDTPQIIRAQISNSAAYAQRMLGNLGGWGNGDATPSNASQYWGDISSFYMYNRVLSNDEILKVFNATRNRYGI